MEIKINIVEDSIIGSDKAELAPDGRYFRKDLPPGSAIFLKGMDEKIASLMFVCPCGCGSVSSLALRPPYGPPVWNWNGDESKPTLTPSIQKTIGCNWHGWLTDGVFKQA